MKYLKPFNESILSNEYFTKIDLKEFMNQSNPIEFNPIDLNKITEYLTTLNSISNGYLITMEKGRFQDKAIIKSYKNLQSSNKHMDSLMDIYSDKDEWYYVFLCSKLKNHSEYNNKDETQFIKCDQFEGLMFFLKSLKLKSYV